MCSEILNLKSRTNQVSSSLLGHSRLSGPVLELLHWEVKYIHTLLVEGSINTLYPKLWAAAFNVIKVNDVPNTASTQ